LVIDCTTTRGPADPELERRLAFDVLQRAGRIFADENHFLRRVTDFDPGTIVEFNAQAGVGRHGERLASGDRRALGNH
jgi:hypothetical protein